MSPTRPFPRPDYAALELYRPDRRPVPVDLSDNTNLWGTHPGALAALRSVGEDELARYPDLYADELKAAAAEHLGVEPGNVCTGAGSDDLLDSAFRAAATEGGVVAYAAPTFSMVGHFARMNGREARAVAWADAAEDPSRLLEDDPVLVYVCRPNNPTGELAPRAWMQALLEEVRRDGPLVLVDEAYADFAGESLADLATTHPRLLVTRTLSKAYGLAGLRVGLGVASPEVALEVEKSRGPYKVARPAQAAAVAAIRDEESWMERTVAACLENRARLREALEERGPEPLESAANFLFVPVDDAAATATALRERGVAVRPFPAEAGTGVGDGVRVTVGPWRSMERFLEAWDEVAGAGRREAEAATRAERNPAPDARRGDV